MDERSGSMRRRTLIGLECIESLRETSCGEGGAACVVVVFVEFVDGDIMAYDDDVNDDEIE